MVYYLVLGAFKNVTLKLKEQLQITSALHYRILLYCQSSRLNTHSARKVNAFCKLTSKRKCLSHSLRPLIDTCQKCSTSPANHEPRSPANGVFKIQGFVRKRFLPSPPLPPPFFGWLPPHFPRRQNTENPVPRSFFAPKPYGNACYAV